GAWIGIAAGIVALLVIGVGGSFAGYAWGRALGGAAAAARDANSGDPGAGDGGGPSPSPGSGSSGLTGDLPLVVAAPDTLQPTLSADLGAEWKNTETDGAYEQFVDDATQCVVAIEHGDQFDAEDGWTDASGSGYFIDDYESSLRADKTYADVLQNQLTPRWVDATGGGRVQFMSSFVSYSIAETGEYYRTDVLARVMAQSAWYMAVYVDCPQSVGNTERTRITEKIIAGLSIDG
ncbi:MAG: hypothetical protein J0I44_12085, partial [Microbacterium sp.]|nr:hypothetical protein [Microbacterium sp.]